MSGIAGRAEAVTLGRVEGMGERLIDKVSDFGENSVAQFYSQQAGSDRTAQVPFKVFNHSGWQIGVPTKQSQQRPTLHWAFVVSRYSTRRANRKLERNCSSAR